MQATGTTFLPLTIDIFGCMQLKNADKIKIVDSISSFSFQLILLYPDILYRPRCKMLFLIQVSQVSFSVFIVIPP